LRFAIRELGKHQRVLFGVREKESAPGGEAGKVGKVGYMKGKVQPTVVEGADVSHLEGKGVLHVKEKGAGWS